MKYLFLTYLLFASCICFAQLATRTDIIGIWHFSKMTKDGEIILDISNRQVGKVAALKILKNQKPYFTKEDEKKALEDIRQMQDAFSKIFCTFKAKGS